jgi:hypothetical protein
VVLAVKHIIMINKGSNPDHSFSSVYTNGKTAAACFSESNFIIDSIFSASGKYFLRGRCIKADDKIPLTTKADIDIAEALHKKEVW